MDQELHSTGKECGPESRNRATHGVRGEEQHKGACEEDKPDDTERRAELLLERPNIGVVLLGEDGQHAVLQVTAGEEDQRRQDHAGSGDHAQLRRQRPRLGSHQQRLRGNGQGQEQHTHRHPREVP